MTDTERFAIVSATLQRLIKAVGQEGVCSRCRRKIYWLITKNGKPAPYTEEGISHFADCPAATSFRRPRVEGA